MRYRLAALLTAALVLLTPAAANAAAPETPPRDDGLNETIYWVHGLQIGLEAPAADCKQWDAAINRYRGGSFTGTARTVAYYAGDKNCNTRIASAGQGTSIRELGRLLAWDIHDRYSKNGESVDVVGHSMGGLIIRAAVTGVQKQVEGFPPFLFIEDAVTVSTPHTGTPLANACGYTQCREMRPGSSFLAWLSKDPHTTQRTDFTLIGSEEDVLVPWRSAVVSESSVVGYFVPGHRVVFTEGSGLDHSGLVQQTGNSGFDLRYWNSLESDQGWRTRTDTVSPVVMARNGNFHAHRW